MIRSTRNQIGNAQNPFQGNTKKVLTVCSAGLLRSPTLAAFLLEERGYNVRACGTCEEFALIPISTALVGWADVIYFVNQENLDEVEDQYLRGKEVRVLDLPDEHDYGSEELKTEISYQLTTMFGENW